MTAEEVIALLRLAPHPEGGFYRQTFRGLKVGTEADGERYASTAIYYLLSAGRISTWHRVVDADEVWHYYAGAPLELTMADGPKRSTMILGSDLAAGQRPQGVVPVGVWQTARSLGEWTLVGCTVSPGFQYESFEMAPSWWEPG
ncbi:MAG TPA: cupin domain-containing protein [Thermoanaerobaculia bacterium]|nr:cupin domain-containing protein [Thermoanaerobaculia bacterium]